MFIENLLLTISVLINFYVVCVQVWRSCLLGSSSIPQLVSSQFLCLHPLDMLQVIIVCIALGESGLA